MPLSGSVAPLAVTVKLPVALPWKKTIVLEVPGSVRRALRALKRSRSRRRARGGRVDEDDGGDARGVPDVVRAGQRVGVAEAVGRNGVVHRAGRGDVRCERRRVAGDRAGSGADARSRRRGLRADERVAAGGLRGPTPCRTRSPRRAAVTFGDTFRELEKPPIETAPLVGAAVSFWIVKLVVELVLPAASVVSASNVGLPGRARREGEAVRVEACRCPESSTCPRCGSCSSRRWRSSRS